MLRIKWTTCCFLLVSSLVLAQEEKKVFNAPLVVADNQIRMNDLGDMDADGDMDGVSWYWRNSLRQEVFVRVFTNTAQQGFVESFWTLLNIMPVAMQAPTTWDSLCQDFDNDGIDEFVLVIGHQLFVVGRNSMTSGLTTRFSRVITGEFNGVACGDFDGDGDIDLATSDSGRMRFYLNDPVSGFVDGPVFSLPGVESVIAADADNDGKSELVCLLGLDVRTFELVGANVTPLQSIAHGVAQGNGKVIRPSVGDVNGDTFEDIVVFSHLKIYSVLAGNGTGTYVPSPLQLGGPADRLVDIDGDGDLDGVCCGGGGGGGTPTGTPVLNETASMFLISFNDGTGQFAESTAMLGLGAERLAGASDLDGDGDIDLVGGRCVFYANGPIVEPIVGEGRRGGVGLGGLFDIDGDSDVDVLEDVSTVKLNSANASFYSLPLGVQAPPSTYFTNVVASGDFDGDGFDDFICEKRSIMSNSHLGMHLIRGNGNGQFVDAGLCGQPNEVFLAGSGQLPVWKQSFAADVDTDGDLDLVIGGEIANQSKRLWLNNGTGVFLPGNIVPALQRVADLDGDGLNDLVYNSSYIQWGLGGANWSNIQNPGPYFASSVEVIDFDKDGLLDIVGYGLNGNLIWINLGNRQFVQLTGPKFSHFAPNYYPDFFAVRDVDSDGDYDLVASGDPTLPGSTITIIKDPIYLFSATAPTATNITVHTMTGDYMTDLDGDGDDDLIGEQVYLNLDRTVDDSGIIFQYGFGVGGAGGYIPRLSAVGPLSAGSTATLKVSGLTGGALFHLVVGDTPVNQPGIPLPSLTNYTNATTIYDLITSGPFGASGSGTLDISYIVPAGLSGVPFFHQVYAFDPGAPDLYTSSAGLAIRYQ